MFYKFDTHKWSDKELKPLANWMAKQGLIKDSSDVRNKCFYYFPGYELHFCDNIRDIEVSLQDEESTWVGPNSYHRYLKTIDPSPDYYQYTYKGIKLDPYRLADILQIGGGAREQIFKKAIRWTSKGDDERKVINEIISACERRLEMLDEDGK